MKLTAADYATGLALGVVCFNVANLYAKHISIINHANLGFSIHTFAFMVILMAILNMTNILPENVMLKPSHKRVYVSVEGYRQFLQYKQEKREKAM